ncbi:hypothetical protein Nepgr_002791 [Nepenthes gracilis]|uniref:Uncharacterized protein n=1 Tax=Nepenthes gracilis TaxID=150966 RepID=A0AAD3PAB8_NEPGR|nr:hypothetical protein Nepgr_002791 [Nepenthes gracilis]
MGRGDPLPGKIRVSTGNAMSSNIVEVEQVAKPEKQAPIVDRFGRGSSSLDASVADHIALCVKPGPKVVQLSCHSFGSGTEHLEPFVAYQEDPDFDELKDPTSGKSGGLVDVSSTWELSVLAQEVSCLGLDEISTSGSGLGSMHHLADAISETAPAANCLDAGSIGVHYIVAGSSLCPHAARVDLLGKDPERAQIGLGNSEVISVLSDGFLEKRPPVDYAANGVDLDLTLPLTSPGISVLVSPCGDLTSSLSDYLSPRAQVSSLKEDVLDRGSVIGCAASPIDDAGVTSYPDQLDVVDPIPLLPLLQGGYHETNQGLEGRLPGSFDDVMKHGFSNSSSKPSRPPTIVSPDPSALENSMCEQQNLVVPDSDSKLKDLSPLARRVAARINSLL